MIEKIQYTKEEIIEVLIFQQSLYEVARLVDVSMTFQLELSEDKKRLVRTQYDCYAVWNKGHRCENCVSAKAFMCKGKKTKFEFVENDTYYVVAKYVEVDGTPYMLEMVTKIDDDTLVGAYGKEEFVQTITGHNRQLYIDSLTQAYNRNYYDTQLLGLAKVTALAIMDIDHFKGVNDTYGHGAGDAVLKNVIATILGKVRSSDSVVRYGGDEFVILFDNLAPEFLELKLEELRKSVEELTFEGYPGLKTSISVGAVGCDICSKEVVEAADKLLYEAKQKRNCVVCQKAI